MCPGMEKIIFFIILDFHINHTKKKSGYPINMQKKLFTNKSSKKYEVSELYYFNF